MFPWFALLLPPLLWAGNYIVGRAMRGEMPPMTLSLGRWLIAIVCLLPFAVGAIRRDGRRYWAHRYLVLRTSASGVAAFNSLVYLGLHTTTASNAMTSRPGWSVRVCVGRYAVLRAPLARRAIRRRRPDRSPIDVRYSAIAVSFDVKA